MKMQKIEVVVGYIEWTNNKMGFFFEISNYSALDFEFWKLKNWVKNQKKIIF